MTQKIVSFIGGGNMAVSLIGGMINDGYAPAHIWVSDPNPSQVERLKANWQINATTNNQVCIEQGNIIVFAVKPQILQEVAAEIGPLINKQALGISIAAGIRLPDLARWLGERLPLVRAMPNTPAMIGCGATGLFAGPGIEKEQQDVAQHILASVGITLWVPDEALLDTVTALSGSGPAYFFYMMDALQQAATTLGLSAQDAHLLTTQTALGAAQMALQSTESLDQLRQRVTSPGGTTEAALNVLNTSKVNESFKNALHAAHKRSQELAANLGDKE